MPYQAHYRTLAVAMVFSLVITLSLFIPNVSANDGDDVVDIQVEKTQLTYPNLGSELDRLATGSRTVEGPNKDSAGGDLISQGGSIAVTIHLSGHVDAVVAFLNDHGGDPRNVGEDYIEAYVPISLLGPLSEQPGVLRVRRIVPPQPTQLVQQVIGHGPAVHGSMPWNEAGYGGQGVKVGIIDGFFRFSSLQGIEVPSSVVVRCYTDIGVYTSNLADCDQEPEATSPWPECLDAYQRRARGGASHGTIVAESLLDIAPRATLYIANPGSKGDMQEAVAWMASQGVQVINFSASWTLDGPGDGTSPFSFSPLNTVDQAVANDVLWVNSGGNSAQDTWFGSYSDPDGNGAIRFGGNNDEVMDTPWRACSVFTVQLRWDDDWSGAKTDLDLHIVHKPTGEVLFSSDDPQSGQSGQVPWEALQLRTRVNTDDFGVVVSHKGGEEPDWIQVLAWTANPIEHHTLSGSIGNPAESANSGLLAVGAAPWFDVNSIEFFSSRGPTPDGRTKPEIVGADCGETALTPLRFSSRFGGDCGFAGTSQASPHVAGLAALVRQRFPDFTAEEIAAYLKDHAEPRGAVPNNIWGYGLAKLPATDVGDCLHELTTDGTTDGQWSAQCQSLAFERGFAQYYSFNLEEDSQVTIDLNSSVDPYLFLREGDARSGDFVDENDDVEAGVNLNSRIAATLPAGTYTIEATTYDTGETGDFTLTISGLGGDGVTGATPDGCGQTIIGDVTTTGEWAAGCQSAESGRGYARYYSFTTTETSDVTITLASTVDPYLYLRSGNRTGSLEAQNDDHGTLMSTAACASPGGLGNTDSCITIAGLSEGTYTIEATTYAENQTGDFTLTISGLSGTATGPDPAPGTDTCAATSIDSDGATPGTWAADCQSQERSGHYARYYTFATTETRDVTITLTSTVDPYLYLRSSDATGSVETENDDHGTLVDTAACASPGGLGNRDSCITIAGLSSGTYTIEATTYAESQTGDFTLTVSGLSGTTAGPGPDPGTDACAATSITASDSPVSGTWAADCQSQDRRGRYARYYTFTLQQQSTVTIDLVSSVDPFLYLRSGDARSGTTPHENDDVEPGANLNSRISESLAAGTWTIEATTYAENQTGDFTLTISGLGGNGDGMETDTCAATTITAANGPVAGTWAADCQSQERSGRYARYYTFTLQQQSTVTIELTSDDVDTYLYLRQGEARSGDAEHENDDIESGGVNLNSRISEALADGTWTIEATTYVAELEGSFTLSISGLGGGAG